jgi:peroxiredoxin family protein
LEFEDLNIIQKRKNKSVHACIVSMSKNSQHFTKRIDTGTARQQQQQKKQKQQQQQQQQQVKLYFCTLQSLS